MNFVNFPNTMWYEKFNWNLYSCSTIKDAAIPVSAPPEVPEGLYDPEPEPEEPTEP